MSKSGRQTIGNDSQSKILNISLTNIIFFFNASITKLWSTHHPN